MRAVLLSLMVATSTSPRPVTNMERRLAEELSEQIRVVERLRYDIQDERRKSELRVAALISEARRQADARRECEEAPAEVPGWVGPVVAVALGVVAAGGAYAVVELSQ